MEFLRLLSQFATEPLAIAGLILFFGAIWYWRHFKLEVAKWKNLVALAEKRFTYLCLFKAHSNLDSPVLIKVSLCNLCNSRGHRYSQENQSLYLLLQRLWLRRVVFGFGEAVGLIFMVWLLLFAFTYVVFEGKADSVAFMLFAGGLVFAICTIAVKWSQDLAEEVHTAAQTSDKTVNKLLALAEGESGEINSVLEICAHDSS